MFVNIQDLRFGRHPSGAIGIIAIPDECRGTFVPRGDTTSEEGDDSLTPEPGHEALAERHGFKTRHLQESVPA
jgi:hypothetical protein